MITVILQTGLHIEYTNAVKVLGKTSCFELYDYEDVLLVIIPYDCKAIIQFDTAQKTIRKIN